MRPRALTAAAILAAAALAAVALPSAGLALAARGRHYGSAASAPARSVAIVPGARVAAGQPLAILRDRLEAALALYRAGRVRAILVSGNDVPVSPEVTTMRDWLRARDVPASAIWTDGGGTRTRETMLRAAALYDVKDAIVCTQTVNMARTLFLARAAGIDAVGIALPTNLSRSARYLGIEALKTTLAVVESVVRDGPESLQQAQGRLEVASR